MGAIALASLGMPAAATAGTYTWSLPSEFTVSGSNPDHGPYGDAPWTYADGTGPVALARLDTFEPNVQGGLVGWTDSRDMSALVGTNPKAEPITGGTNNEDTFAPGQMVLEPTHDHAVAVRWTSPLAGTIAVTATVVSDETASTPRSACASLGWDTWSLDLNGSQVQGQTGTVPDSTQAPHTIAASASVAPGDAIDLVVTAGNGAAADPACAPVGVTLQLHAPGTAPAPALDQPAASAVIDDGQPRFSGTAGAAFGDASTVTIRVYRGTEVGAGAPVETLSGDVADAGFSVAPSPFLYDGTYTAQVEQDDAVGDNGFSQPVTFKIADPLPPITLAPLGDKPLRTAEPTLSGTSGTLDGDSAQIEVYVWPGTRPHGYALRHLLAARGSDGRWSIRITPSLVDGEYVAIAAQNGPAGVIGSQLVRFQVKVHPPVVTLTRPPAGRRVRSRGFVVSGSASTAAGDLGWVTVTLYRGSSLSRRPVETLRVGCRHGRWSVRWHRRLAAGLYTVRATQRDAAGNVGASAPRAFIVRGRSR